MSLVTDFPAPPPPYVPPKPRPDASFRVEAGAVVLSLLVSLALLAIKFRAYYLTNSVAIFSDAMENIVNVLAAVVALYSIYLAHRPADREHPYGHGKIEFFSAGFEGGMIFLAAVLIAVEAALTLISRRGPDTQQLDAGLWLIAIAMAVNGLVGLLLWQVGKRRSSITLEADGVHLLSDAVSSAAVLVSLTLVRLTGARWIDPAAAVILAGYIALMGAKLVRRSWAGLMDEQDIDDDELLRRILDAHLAHGPAGAATKPPHICSYHKLRHRHSGRYHWVDFHIMVPGAWDVDQGHRVASAIEYEIERALGEGNATAHVEPCPGGDCAACKKPRGERPAPAAANGEGSRPALGPV